MRERSLKKRRSLLIIVDVGAPVVIIGAAVLVPNLITIDSAKGHIAPGLHEAPRPGSHVAVGSGHP